MTLPLLVTPATGRVDDLRAWLAEAGVSLADERWPGVVDAASFRVGGAIDSFAALSLLAVVADLPSRTVFPPDLVERLLGAASGVAEAASQALGIAVVIAHPSARPDAVAVAVWRRGAVDGVYLEAGLHGCCWTASDGWRDHTPPARRWLGMVETFLEVPAPSFSRPAGPSPGADVGDAALDMLVNLSGLRNVPGQLVMVVFFVGLAAWVGLGLAVGELLGIGGFGALAAFWVAVVAGVVWLWRSRPPGAERGRLGGVVGLLLTGASLIAVARTLKGTDGAELAGTAGVAGVGLALVWGWYQLFGGPREQVPDDLDD